MIDLKEVLSIHAILIERFGGTTGVRDQGAIHETQTQSVIRNL
jgi:hypothetical protein